MKENRVSRLSILVGILCSTGALPDTTPSVSWKQKMCRVVSAGAAV